MSENKKTSAAVSVIQTPAGTVTPRKRVGRGPASGTGCTAGRGTKGQKARSGGKVRPGFEGGQMPLYRRLPRRGFSNYPFKQKPVVLSLAFVDAKYAAGETVSLQTLREKKLIKNSDLFVKILGTGDVSKSVTIARNVFVALSVREKITAKGGTVVSPDTRGKQSAETQNKKDMSDKNDKSKSQEETGPSVALARGAE